MHYNSRCLLTPMTSDDPSEMDEDEFLDSIDKSSAHSSGFLTEESVLDSLDDGATAPVDGRVADLIYKLADAVPMKAEFVYELKVTDDPDWLGMDGTPKESATYETYGLSTTPQMTEQLLTRIAQEVEQREKQGYEIQHLILGQPQYSALEAYARDEYHGDSVEMILPVDEITVVPGPQIHPVIPNRRMLIEYEAER